MVLEGDCFPSFLKELAQNEFPEVETLEGVCHVEPVASTGSPTRPRHIRKPLFQAHPSSEQSRRPLRDSNSPHTLLSS